MESCDLYEAVKALSQEILFSIFLDLESNVADSAEEYKRMQHLSQTISRGQFSAPVNLRLGFYSSPHNRGLQAKRQYDEYVRQQVKQHHCPFLATGSGSSSNPDADRPSPESQCTHIGMFASALVIKSLASYLTYLFLQLFKQGQHNGSLADHLSHDNLAELLSVMLETERLSPPIIGSLRRVTNLPYHIPNQNLFIPVGWDCWLYYPLINRSKIVYGNNADSFQADRFLPSTAGKLVAMLNGSDEHFFQTARQLCRRHLRLVMARRAALGEI